MRDSQFLSPLFPYLPRQGKDSKSPVKNTIDRTDLKLNDIKGENDTTLIT